MSSKFSQLRDQAKIKRSETKSVERQQLAPIQDDSYTVSQKMFGKNFLKKGMGQGGGGKGSPATSKERKLLDDLKQISELNNMMRGVSPDKEGGNDFQKNLLSILRPSTAPNQRGFLGQPNLSNQNQPPLPQTANQGLNVGVPQFQQPVPTIVQGVTNDQFQATGQFSSQNTNPLNTQQVQILQQMRPQTQQDQFTMQAVAQSPLKQPIYQAQMVPQRQGEVFPQNQNQQPSYQMSNDIVKDASNQRQNVGLMNKQNYQNQAQKFNQEQEIFNNLDSVIDAELQTQNQLRQRQGEKQFQQQLTQQDQILPNTTKEQQREEQKISAPFQSKNLLVQTPIFKDLEEIAIKSKNEDLSKLIAQRKQDEQFFDYLQSLHSKNQVSNDQVDSYLKQKLNSDVFYTQVIKIAQEKREPFLLQFVQTILQDIIAESQGRKPEVHSSEVTQIQEEGIDEEDKEYEYEPESIKYASPNTKLAVLQQERNKLKEKAQNLTQNNPQLSRYQYQEGSQNQHSPQLKFADSLEPTVAIEAYNNQMFSHQPMSPENEYEQKDYLQVRPPNQVHKSQPSYQNIYVPLPIAEKSNERPKIDSSLNVNFQGPEDPDIDNCDDDFNDRDSVHQLPPPQKQAQDKSFTSMKSEIKPPQREYSNTGINRSYNQEQLQSSFAQPQPVQKYDHENAGIVDISINQSQAPIRKNSTERVQSAQPGTKKSGNQVVNVQRAGSKKDIKEQVDIRINKPQKPQKQQVAKEEGKNQIQKSKKAVQQQNMKQNQIRDLPQVQQQQPTPKAQLDPQLTQLISQQILMMQQQMERGFGLIGDKIQQIEGRVDNAAHQLEIYETQQLEQQKAQRQKDQETQQKFRALSDTITTQQLQLQSHVQRADQEFNNMMRMSQQQQQLQQQRPMNDITASPMINDERSFEAQRENRFGFPTGNQQNVLPAIQQSFGQFQGTKQPHQTQKSPSSRQSKLQVVWGRALDLIKKRQYEEGYRLLLKEGDDMYLLRMLAQTGPVVKHLEDQTAITIINRVNKIVRSGAFEAMETEWLEDAQRRGIFQQLSKYEQNEYLDTLFHFSKSKMNPKVSEKASEVYTQIKATVSQQQQKGKNQQYL